MKMAGNKYTKRVRLSFDMDLFIESVRSYPQLYDKRNPNYKDTAMRKAIWTAIATKCGITGAEAEKKWKVQRDRYSKEVKKRKDLACSDSGFSEVYIPTWKMFTIMESILSPCLFPNESTVTTFTNSSANDLSTVTNIPMITIVSNGIMASETQSDCEDDDTDEKMIIKDVCTQSVDCPQQEQSDISTADFCQTQLDKAHYNKPSTSGFDPQETSSKIKERNSTSVTLVRDTLRPLGTSTTRSPGHSVPRPNPSNNNNNDNKPDTVASFCAYLEVRLRNLDSKDRRAAMRDIEIMMLEKEDSDKYV